MSVKYYLIERVDPGDPALSKKYFAQIKNGDAVSFDDLVSLVAQFSTFKEGDIYGVIYTLLNVIPHQLKYGRTINLGKLGTLYMTIKSNGKSSEEEFLHSDIQNARIRFRPGSALQTTLKTLDFEKVDRPGDKRQTRE